MFARQAFTILCHHFYFPAMCFYNMQHNDKRNHVHYQVRLTLTGQQL